MSLYAHTSLDVASAQQIPEANSAAQHQRPHQISTGKRLWFINVCGLDLDYMQVLGARSQIGHAGHRASTVEVGAIAEASLPGSSADVSSHVCDLT